MQSIAKACQHPGYPAYIALVLSNKPKAKGLQIAQQNGLATALVDHKNFTSREEFEQSIHQHLIAAKVDLVCLAGFMRILSPFLVAKWQGRMLNIHPSLLPRFRGLHTHQRALDAGASEHGCSVHEVTEGLDEGPVLGQAKINVLPTDTKQSLAKRVLHQEHQLYPEIIAKYCR